MRQSVGLQRVKALEVEQGIDEARSRGVAVVHRDEIGAKRMTQIRLLAQRVVESLTYQVARQRRMVETVGNPVHDRILEATVVQHGRIDEGRELGLAAHDIFGLVTDPIPDRIKRSQLSGLRMSLMHCHSCFSQFQWAGLIARRVE